MKQKQPTSAKDYIRYWHPRKGGWYHARLIQQGRKWAIIEPLGQALPKRKRVPISILSPAVLG